MQFSTTRLFVWCGRDAEQERGRSATPTDSPLPLLVLAKLELISNGRQEDSGAHRCRRSE